MASYPSSAPALAVVDNPRPWHLHSSDHEAEREEINAIGADLVAAMGAGAYASVQALVVDVLGRISAEVAARTAWQSGHLAASDPHPQYLTPAEAGALYVPLGGEAVTEVNGQTGAVALDWQDVGAEQAGYAQSLIDALPGLVGLGLIDLDTDVDGNVTINVVDNPTFVGTVTLPNGAVLNTPASLVLTNATGLPQAGVVGLPATLASLAPLANPTFSGHVAVPTPTNPSDAAPKSYVDSAVAGLMAFKGSINASTNPNYPAATLGDAYVVSAAGKVGGASGRSVDIGDTLIAIATNAGGTEAAVGASWDVLEHNLVGAALTSGTLGQFAATTSSALAAVMTDETGTGSLVFGTGPTLVAPALGTPISVVLTNATGLPTAGLLDGAVTAAKLAAGAVGDAAVSSISESKVSGLPADLAAKAPLAGPTFTGVVTMPDGAVLNTPASVNLSNATALPLSAVTGLGTNVAAFLATPTSANLAAAVTDESGTGALVFVNSPVLTGKQDGPLTGDVTTSGTAATLVGTTAVENLVRLNSLDQLAPAAGNVNLNSKKIINLADPALAQDAVTKNYFDVCRGFRAVSGSTSITLADGLVVATAVSGTVIFTLPDASTGTIPVGWTVRVRDASGNANRSGNALAVAPYSVGDSILNNAFGVVGVPGPYEEIALTYAGSRVWYCTFHAAQTNLSTATDLGGTSPSDVLFSSQKAVKAYVDAQRTVRIITSDTDQTLSATDRIVVHKASTLTAGRKWTLPAANAAGAVGWCMTILDDSGLIDYATSKFLTISIAAGSGDTMDSGFAGSTFLVENYGQVKVWSDGVSKIFVSTPISVKDREASTITATSQYKVPSSYALASGTVTLTNKRITKRVTSLGDGRVATITPPSDSCDVYRVGSANAINQNVTIAAPSGTPSDGDELVLELKFDGTSRTVTWNSTYIAQSGLTLTSPVADTKWKTFEFRYSVARTKWVLVRQSAEA